MVVSGFCVLQVKGRNVEGWERVRGLGGNVRDRRRAGGVVRRAFELCQAWIAGGKIEGVSLLGLALLAWEECALQVVVEKPWARSV